MKACKQRGHRIFMTIDSLITSLWNATIIFDSFYLLLSRPFVRSFVHLFVHLLFFFFLYIYICFKDNKKKRIEGFPANALWFHGGQHGTNLNLSVLYIRLNFCLYLSSFLFFSLKYGTEITDYYLETFLTLFWL